MPQKAYEGRICHVMGFAFLFENVASKSKIFIFGTFSVSESITCFLFEMSHFYCAQNISNSHFQNQTGKMGQFKYFENWDIFGKGTCSILKQKINRK